MPIVPIAIVSETAPSSNPPTMSHEMGSVIMTVANIRVARGQDSLNRFEEVVGVPIKKVEFALGWQRSEESAHCSIRLPTPKNQDDDLGEDSNSFRRVPLGWTLSHASVDHMCRERLRDPMLDNIAALLEGKLRGGPDSL